MKLKELLKGRKKLEAYDDLVSRIQEAHLAHVEPNDINNIDLILAFEERRASAIAEYKAEIAKLDEE